MAQTKSQTPRTGGGVSLLPVPYTSFAKEFEVMTPQEGERINKLIVELGEKIMPNVEESTEKLLKISEPLWLEIERVTKALDVFLEKNMDKILEKLSEWSENYMIKR